MVDQNLDIAANRRAQKWTNREMIGRLAWEVLGARLFAWSPRPAWGWRRSILRLFGAKVGQHVRIDPTARIAIPWNLTLGDFAGIGARATLYSLGPISIGKNATISQNAHLCAGSHDFRGPMMRLTKPPICVEEGAWICADAFVGPGVTIGEFGVAGARAVVVRDVAPGVVVAGNPAVQVGVR
jgi:putative colanic acid biosynthesis acetyltransferase WcaF